MTQVNTTHAETTTQIKLGQGGQAGCTVNQKPNNHHHRHRWDAKAKVTNKRGRGEHTSK